MAKSIAPSGWRAVSWCGAGKLLFFLCVYLGGDGNSICRPRYVNPSAYLPNTCYTEIIISKKNCVPLRRRSSYYEPQTDFYLPTPRPPSSFVTDTKTRRQSQWKHNAFRTSVPNEYENKMRLYYYWCYSRWPMVDDELGRFPSLVVRVGLV